MEDNGKVNFWDKKNLLYIVFLLPALIWVIYRLYAVDITHDEAWSFHMAYKQLYENMIRTANNHWLNTLFIFLESKILGTAIWKVRLHSLFAFLFFVYYLIKIISKIPNKWAGLLALTLVCYNTYTLDFFSLARGYALGLAFGMGAIYFILFKTKDFRYRLIIYLLLCLSALSVYTQLYLLFAYGLYEIIFVFKFKFLTKKALIDYIKPLWLPVIFMYFAAKNILYIKKCGDLNEGQSNGFFEDTIGVFVQRSFEPWLSDSLTLLISILLFLLIAACAFMPKKYFDSTYSKKLATMLLIGYGIHEVFFHFLKVPYAFGRTSLYYIVPLLLCFGLFIGEINFSNIKKFISPLLFSIIVAFHFFYLAGSKNIHTTNEWWMGQDVSKALKKIKSIEDRNLNALSLLYYEGHNGVFLNYYNILNGQDIFKRVNRIHLSHIAADFEAIDKNPNQFDYILLPDYDSVINSVLIHKNYDSIQYFDNMKTWLLKKKIL